MLEAGAMLEAVVVAVDLVVVGVPAGEVVAAVAPVVLLPHAAATSPAPSTAAPVRI
jgi:hypothetical protein